MNLPLHLVLQPVGLLLLAALWVHERGRRRLGPDGRRHVDERRQTWLFRLGAGLGAAGLFSPLAHYAADDLFARTLLEVLLGWTAAPLVVLGAPWQALRAGLGTDPGRLGAPPPPEAARSSVARVVGPLAGVGTYLAVLWCFHVPAIEDATVHSLALRSIELACVLVAGVLLWTQLVASWPYRPGWEPLGRIALVAASLAGTWVLAAPLVYSSHSWYPAFTTGPTAMLSTVARQALAGGALWALPAIPLGVFTFWCFAEWLKRDNEDEWRLRSLLERATSPPEAAIQEVQGR